MRIHLRNSHYIVAALIQNEFVSLGEVGLG
jgi:hypothetical protein